MRYLAVFAILVVTSPVFAQVQPKPEGPPPTQGMLAMDREWASFSTQAEHMGRAIQGIVVELNAARADLVVANKKYEACIADFDKCKAEVAKAKKP